MGQLQTDSARKGGEQIREYRALLGTLRAEQGRFDEALTECRRILKYYPDEVEAYERAIWLYVEVFDEPSRARRLVARAKRRRLTLDEDTVRIAQGRFGPKRETP